jgi:hypothetical protein
MTVSTWLDISSHPINSKSWNQNQALTVDVFHLTGDRPDSRALWINSRYRIHSSAIEADSQLRGTTWDWGITCWRILQNLRDNFKFYSGFIVKSYYPLRFQNQKSKFPFLPVWVENQKSTTLVSRKSADPVPISDGLKWWSFSEISRGGSYPDLHW